METVGDAQAHIYRHGGHYRFFLPFSPPISSPSLAPASPWQRSSCTRTLYVLKAPSAHTHTLLLPLNKQEKEELKQ